MKIIITIKFQPSASEQGIAEFKRCIAETLRHDLMLPLRACSPDNEQNSGDPEVDVVIQ